MKRRRNPGSSSTLPLLLVGAGIGLFVLSKRQEAAAAPVSGIGSWFSKTAKKATKGVSRTLHAVTDPVQNLNIKDAAVFAAGGGIAQAAKMGLQAAKKMPSNVLAVATGGTSLLLAKTVVQKVMPGKRSPPPPAGSKVVYQDENGHPISKAEYERRQALYEAQSQCYAKGMTWNGTACVASTAPVSDPGYGPTASGQSFVQPPSDQSSMYPSSGGGGSSGSSQDFGPPPDASATPTADQSAPMDPPPAPPAPTGKLNPLVAVATFAAVPLLLGLTGDK